MGANCRQETCYICNCKVKIENETSQELENHLKIHNKPNEELECDICGVKFKLSRNFKRHYLAHIEAKTFNCSSCGRSFNSKQHLRRHEAIHDNRQYLCSGCGKEFSVKDYYHIHRKKCKFVVKI